MITSLHSRATRGMYVIAKFGRFPQYNKELSRPTTKEEKKFLKTGVL